MQQLLHLVTAVALMLGLVPSPWCRCCPAPGNQPVRMHMSGSGAACCRTPLTVQPPVRQEQSKAPVTAAAWFTDLLAAQDEPPAWRAGALPATVRPSPPRVLRT